MSVSRAAELRHPILILHSDDDGFVPSDASHDLVVARPDLVEMQVFEVARHTKLWNYDQERWSDSIRRWLERQGLAARTDALRRATLGGDLALGAQQHPAHSGDAQRRDRARQADALREVVRDRQHLVGR